MSDAEQQPKNGFVETLQKVFDTVLGKISQGTLFAAQRTAFINYVAGDLRNDIFAGQITSLKDFILSAVTSAGTYAVTDILANHKSIKPIIDKVGKAFDGLPSKAVEIVRDMILDIGAGLVADLAAGKLNSPRDIAVSAIASVATTFLTDIVVNYGLDNLKNILFVQSEANKDNKGGGLRFRSFEEIKANLKAVFANFGKQGRQQESSQGLPDSSICK